MQTLDTDRPAGVFTAVLTPFDETGAPDHGTLSLHCRWLLANGSAGLAVLGTTGEANSLSVEERLRLLERLVADGIPAGVLMPGTGCCAVTDTARLTSRAVQLGCAGVLMLPPFYYKAPSEDGVFAAVAEVLERVGEGRLRVYLYHFPQMSGVPFGPSLIERLLKRYPGTIAGLKDSSGDLGGMLATAARFPGLSVFSGGDEFLLPLLEGGGAGCITGVCNVAAPLAAQVHAAWARGDGTAAAESQARLSAVRAAFLGYPLSAALKAVLARHSGRAGWLRMRPPLAPLPAVAADDLLASLDRIGFRPATIL